MATKVIIKKSAVAGNEPTAAQIEYGELAINVADKKIYTKDNNGNIITLGSGASRERIDGGNYERVVVFDGDDSDPTATIETLDGGESVV